MGQIQSRTPIYGHAEIFTRPKNNTDLDVFENMCYGINTIYKEECPFSLSKKPALLGISEFGQNK